MLRKLSRTKVIPEDVSRFFVLFLLYVWNSESRLPPCFWVLLWPGQSQFKEIENRGYSIISFFFFTNDTIVLFLSYLFPCFGRGVINYLKHVCHGFLSPQVFNNTPLNNVFFFEESKQTIFWIKIIFSQALYNKQTINQSVRAEKEHWNIG